MSPNSFFLALTIVIGCTSHCTHATRVAAFVLNGNEVIDGSYPWQLSFQRLINNNWYHICGGSLISDSFALTAAHCLYSNIKNENGTAEKYRLADLRVVAGVNRVDPLDSDGEIREIEDTTTPLGLHGHFDVALLKLRTPVNTSRPDISPITIAQDADDVTGRQCFVTGWGSTSAIFIQVTPLLRVAAMTLVQKKDCEAAGWRGMSTYQTCATGNPRQNSICTGDSGGPLTCLSNDGTQILMGVSSFTYKRCSTSRPNIFGKLSKYRNWLRTLTKISDL